ncbi:MAG: hypothetical protein WDZ28_02720 [Simkaniaceae bacterium]
MKVLFFVVIICLFQGDLFSWEVRTSRITFKEDAFVYGESALNPVWTLMDDEKGLFMIVPVKILCSNCKEHQNELAQNCKICGFGEFDYILCENKLRFKANLDDEGKKEVELEYSYENDTCNAKLGLKGRAEQNLDGKVKCEVGLELETSF